MATVPLGTHLHHYCRLFIPPFHFKNSNHSSSSLCYYRSSSVRTPILNNNNGAKSCQFRPSYYDSKVLKPNLRASANSDTAVIDSAVSDDVMLTFPLQRIRKVDGKIIIRLDHGNDEENWQLTVGCNLPGKWVLHWGVNYANDIGSEWDQPPVEMRPLNSVTIKDYAIETPLTKSSTAEETDTVYEVKIAFNIKSSITAVNFVLKDEKTGSWYQYRGRDFKVPLVSFSDDDDNAVGNKQGFAVWPGQLSSMMIQSEDTHSENENNTGDSKESVKSFYIEHPIVQETVVENSMTVYIKRCSKTLNYLVNMETDIPDDVIVHWGVSKNESKKWEIPSGPYPASTLLFKNKALRTPLQRKENGNGCYGEFSLDEETAGFLFVLKLNDNTWINNMGNDFYIPIPKENKQETKVDEEDADTTYADEIINEIRHLVSGISSDVSRKAKTKEAQELILQEIEKLAAEAYGIFRSSVPTPPEIIEEVVDVDTAVKISSATGTGFEILFQGFNWESNKSGKWYVELEEKAAELASLGFTIVWLPPPTESISPEGYMPRDLYNLNSRYFNTHGTQSFQNQFYVETHINHLYIAH